MNGWESSFELLSMRFIFNVTQYNTGTVHFLSDKVGEQRRGEEISFYSFFFYLLCVCLDVYVCVSNAKAQEFKKRKKELRRELKL